MGRHYTESRSRRRILRRIRHQDNNTSSVGRAVNGQTMMLGQNACDLDSAIRSAMLPTLAGNTPHRWAAAQAAIQMMTNVCIEIPDCYSLMIFVLNLTPPSLNRSRLTLWSVGDSVEDLRGISSECSSHTPSGIKSSGVSRMRSPKFNPAGLIVVEISATLTAQDLRNYIFKALANHHSCDEQQAPNH